VPGIVAFVVASLMTLVNAGSVGAVDLPVLGETNAVVYTGVHAWLWSWSDHPLRPDGEAWDIAIVFGNSACRDWGCAYSFEAQAVQGYAYCSGISGGLSTGFIQHVLIGAVECETGWFSATPQPGALCFGSASGAGGTLGFSLQGRGAGEGVCGAI
jgi:hypothetical protein